MIGTELLNLMYGNPLSQVNAAVNPAPNPSPLAPPPAGAPAPGGAPAPSAGAHPPLQSHWQELGARGAPAPGGPPAGSPGAPAAPPNPQASLPPTAATQSPPDLAQLYMQLEQRNRSANEIDRGLAMMASAYAAPGTQQSIMNSAGGPIQHDPGAELGNLIQLQYMQKMQSAPAPAGVDPAVWNMLPPDAKLKMQQDAAKGGLEANLKLQENRQGDVLEAREKAPAAIQQMTQMDTIADQIRDAKVGDTPVLQGILGSSVKKGAAMYLLEPHKEGEGGVIDQAKLQAATALLSPQEQAVVNQIKQLDNQIYGEAFQATGSRRTQQEVANIRAGISPLKNFNQSYDDYMKQYDNFQNQLHKSIGNTYGAAQDLDTIPEKYRWGSDGQPLVDHSYLPGGPLYEGKGGDWVHSPPTQTAGGVPTSFDYGKIPSGSVYTAPDGTRRRKP